MRDSTPGPFIRDTLGESFDDSAMQNLAQKQTEMLNERLKEAVADGYDYFYVVRDYNVRALPEIHEDARRSGQALTSKIRVKATDIEPDALLPGLQAHGSAHAYDLTDLSDDERQKIASGEIPNRLREQSRSVGDRDA